MYACGKESQLTVLPTLQLERTPNHTLARGAEILSMENANNYRSSELMATHVLCTLNNMGSPVHFLESMCPYTTMPTHRAFTKSLNHAQNIPGKSNKPGTEQIQG